MIGFIKRRLRRKPEKTASASDERKTKRIKRNKKRIKEARRQSGKPCGKPHRKDYHKKTLAQFRWDKSVLLELKEQCKLYGIYPSDLTEIIIREMLHKNSIKRYANKYAVKTAT